MSTKTINILLCLWVTTVVVFINFNSPEYKHIWYLVYYMCYYIIVLIAFILGWIRFKHTLTRSLLIAVGFYYVFHLGVQVLDIFNPELKRELYKGKVINYILALSCGCSLLVLPLIEKLKPIKCLKNFTRWAKDTLSPYGQ